MNRPPEGPDAVAVVVALADPTPALPASLARFAEEAGPRGEVVLVDASPDRSGEAMARRFANVRAIRRPPGRLVPGLWRDGLVATDAPLVAFSTAQMVPDRGWLTALIARLDEAGAAGVGGPIAIGNRPSATDRAVALLRYARYFPPIPSPGAVDPPGENALYRRDRLMGVESAWADGFWEVEVHRALRDRGESLAMAEGAVASFEGGVGLWRMIRRRWAHARRHGAGRSSGLGWPARMARVAAAPMVPPLLCGRIVSALRSRGMGLGPWIPAVPALAVLASAWALGEAAGTWRPDRPPSPTSPARRGGSRRPDPPGIVHPPRHPSTIGQEIP